MLHYTPLIMRTIIANQWFIYISAAAHKEFEIYPEGVMDLQGKGYDYDSIMHYGRTSFTKNGSPTIEAIGNPSRELGGQKLSRGDIDEINRLYDCQSKKTPKRSEI